jgi:hypothetical protein
MRPFSSVSDVVYIELVCAVIHGFGAEAGGGEKW